MKSLACAYFQRGVYIIYQMQFSHNPGNATKL